MIAAALLLAAASPDPIAGTWEGTSLCQVKPSPCHDEHALYRFTALDGGRYRIDAYKVVGGKPDFMGPIEVTLDAGGTDLDGPLVSNGKAQGRMHLKRAGTHMSGRMTLPDGTLFRLIELTRD